MFDNFPKIRQPLSPAYQSIYKKHFLQNRAGSTKASSITSKMESWMHRQIADDVKDSAINPSTLELGAGTLNHLPYEPHITKYDVIEPFEELVTTSIHQKRISHFYKDIFAISGENQYERILSVAVLEHLENLPKIIAKCGLLLKESGSLRSGIPNEGTILWKLGYRLTTGLEFKLRYGLDYDVLMAHEHVNTADEIESVLSYFFKNVTCKTFGISKSFAFYRFYNCQSPDKTRCRTYLGENN